MKCLRGTGSAAAAFPAMPAFRILQRMLMVIFGAGASFDSCPTYPPFQRTPDDAPRFGPEVEGCRPPLANSLFDNRKIFIDTLDEFPQCKGVVPSLRDTAVQQGKTSIETRLEEIRTAALGNGDAAREMVAVRCYLQRALWRCEVAWSKETHDVTNQLDLLREIDMANTSREPVCLVTFNYDRLLEAALKLRGPAYKFEKMQDYTAGDRPFRLFKLHGSVDWGLEYANPLTIMQSTSSGAEAARTAIEQGWPRRQPEVYVFSSALTLQSHDGRPIFPAIAIPVEVKNEFQCPKPMQEALKQLMPDVTRVIVIGWRASEANFRDLMNTHLRPGVRIFVVAGGREEAMGVRDKITRAMPSALRNCTAEDVRGFTQFMRSGLARQIVSDCMKQV